MTNTALARLTTAEIAVRRDNILAAMPDLPMSDRLHAAETAAAMNAEIERRWRESQPKRVTLTEPVEGGILGFRAEVDIPAGRYVVTHRGAERSTLMHDDALARSANDHRPGYWVLNTTLADISL